MPRKNSFLFLGLGIACLAHSVSGQEPKQTPGSKPSAELKKSDTPKPEPKSAAPAAAPAAAPVDPASKEPAANNEPAKEAAEGATGPEPAAKDIPEKMPAFRYEALLAKSPFALATAAPEPVATVENFATNLVLNGLSKNRGKNGQEFYTAFVRSRDLSQRFVFVGEKPDDGITLVSVEDSGPPSEIVVVLKKGAEVGRVKFDQAAIAAAAQQGRPPGAGQPKGVSSSAPKAPIPRPGMSTQSRANATPTPVPPPQPAVPPPNSNMQDPKRRVRPIGAPDSP
jgi:hypothetical protein